MSYFLPRGSQKKTGTRFMPGPWLFAPMNSPQGDRYGLAEGDVVFWLMPRLSCNLTSTRRFCARPATVVLSATASVLPKPIGVTKRRSGIL